MAQLRWGVVGLGRIVRTTMAPAMVAENHCDLVACVSRDRGRADSFAAEFGVRFAYTDYDQMLANPEVDAVFVATPNALHADQVVAAAEAGKHVLCDKPMATNVADAVRAVDACAKAGVALGVNFHYRYLPWVRDVVHLVSSGAIGEVSIVQVEAGAGSRIYDGWRSDPAMSGLGTLYNLGVHVLDLLNLVLRSEVVEVASMFDRDPGTETLDMQDMVLLRLANRTRVYAHFDEVNPYPQNNIALYGSTGRITGEGLTRLPFEGRLELLDEQGTTVTDYPSVDAHRRSVAAFTSAVLAREEPNASGLDGLRSTILCEALAVAATERRSIRVDYGPASASGSRRRSPGRRHRA